MKKQIKITKENIIKDIAKRTGKNVYDIREFYNTLEDTIFYLLCSTDENHDVQIRLFEGINLDGKYIPEKIKKNNLTGKTCFVDSKIKPKFNITRYYCEKLNDK